MRTHGHNHVHFSAKTFDEAAYLVEIAWHIERAVHGAEDVHTRLCTFFALFLGRHPAFCHAKFGEEPGHRTVGGFPLVFVDCARQKALDIRALRSHATTDHFGDRTGDDHSGKGWVQRVPGALHGTFGAVAAKLFFAQSGHHDGQFVRR